MKDIKIRYLFVLILVIITGIGCKNYNARVREVTTQEQKQSNEWIQESNENIEVINDIISDENILLPIDFYNSYAGIFIFDDFQIINQQNYEIDKLDIEIFNRELYIEIGENGFLAGKNFPSAEFFNSEGIFYFKISENHKEIFSSVANGTSWLWYFSDINTINYRVNSSWLGDNEQIVSISYTIHFIRK